jgi:hypothetical protein
MGEEGEKLSTRFDSAINDLGLNALVRTKKVITEELTMINADVKKLQLYMETVQNGIVGLDSKMDNMTEILELIKQTIKTQEVSESILDSVKINSTEIQDVATEDSKLAEVSNVKEVRWNYQPAFRRDLGFCMGDEEVIKVEKEVAVLKMLDKCQYIIKLYGIYNIDKQMYLLMEYAPYGKY